MRNRRQIALTALALAAIASGLQPADAEAQIVDPFGEGPEPSGGGSHASPRQSREAQPEGDEDRRREEARALVLAGVEHARAGRWEEARTSFEQAYQIYPSPNILVNLGAAQAETGQLVAAAQSYRTFLEEADDPRLADRRADVQERLTVLEARIPSLQVRFEGLELGDDVDLDGQTTSMDQLAQGVRLDPGPHRLVVSRSGQILARREVTLAERQPQSLSIDLRPAPEAVAAAEQEQEQVQVNLGADREYRASRTRTMQAMLGSATLLVVGSAIVGGMARRENNRDDVDEARRDALRMTSIGLASGALVFAVIGGAIYATDDRSIDVFGSRDGGGLRLRGTF